MKNKLLLSSALVSGLMVGATVANAQTSITGDLAVAYRALSFTSGGLNSRQGIGRESQLNVQNKGKLNNGMDYAAGFSLEFDGQNITSSRGFSSANANGLSGDTRNAEAASISNENVYFDLIAGSTTFTIGVDHVQNSTSATAPQIVDVYDHVALALGGYATNQLGARTKEYAHVGIVQAIPGTGLTASLIYAPQGGEFGHNDQEVSSNGQRNPSYELGIAGSDIGGVKGLSARYFYNKEKAQNTPTASENVTDLKGKSYGIAYNFGTVAIGFDRMETNRTAGTVTTEVEVQMNRYGVTYAVNKELSVGLVYVKSDVGSGQVGASDEKIKSVQVGYNLGPVALTADYSKITNIAGRSLDNDPFKPQYGKQGQIRLSTKF
jgi:hypothetical protein